MEERSMRKKTIFITGASSGLGRQLAIDFSWEETVLCLFARSQERLENVQRIVVENGGEAHIYPVDLADPQSIDRSFAEAISAVGVVDVLINNAGYGVFEPFCDSQMDENERMFRVNVFGLMRATAAVLPTMREQGSGHIINIASQAGKIATAKSAIYSATKHAVLGFTNSLRMELKGTGIHVSAVNPGPIQTPFFDQADKEGGYTSKVQRIMLDPEDVSEKIVQLTKKPKRELNLPWWMNIGATAYQVAPRLLELLAGKQFRQK
uniref:Oxidoreductase n=2 Tax=Halalkalibacterium halodurans TaxID=86665 RepID=A0A0M0KM69_ALKHA